MRFFPRSKGRIHCFPITFLKFVVALVVGGIFPAQVTLASGHSSGHSTLSAQSLRRFPPSEELCGSLQYAF